MLTLERQEKIKDMLLENKTVQVAELSDLFKVSFETIRRDLKVLEKEGFAEKTYGGAVLIEKVSHKASYQVLSHIMVETKRKLAEAAAAFIDEGDCIYIDFSTTCGQMVYTIPDVQINVLTSSLAVINALKDKEKISLLTTGVMWDKNNYAFMGLAAAQNLKQFHVDKAFISCRGLSIEHGLSDRTEDEASIRSIIIENANEVFLLADESKFDKDAFVKTGDLKRVTTVITDKKTDARWTEFFRNNNIRCIDGHLLESGKWKNSSLWL